MLQFSAISMENWTFVNIWEHLQRSKGRVTVEEAGQTAAIAVSIAANDLIIQYLSNISISIGANSVYICNISIGANDLLIQYINISRYRKNIISRSISNDRQKSVFIRARKSVRPYSKV